jgi:hypothetical protein
MARRNQPNRSIGLDRRQLLAATTAAITVAGVGPIAESAGAANSAEPANLPTIPASNISALNVCASTARRLEEIAARILHTRRWDGISLTQVDGR